MLSSAIAMFAAAAVAASSGQTSTQQDNSQAAAPEPAASTQPDPDQVICRTQAVTGSRFKQRVCKSRRVWEQMSEQADRLMRNADQYSGMSMGSGGGFGGGGGGMGQ
jgi:hypothetical protein